MKKKKAVKSKRKVVKKKVAKRKVAVKSKRKVAVKRKVTKKKAVKSKRKVAVKKKVEDYGTVPGKVDEYEPIIDFDPKNPPSDYIVVRMNHNLLDDMLQGMARKKAMAVGVPCRRV